MEILCSSFITAYEFSKLLHYSFVLKNCLHKLCMDIFLLRLFC